MTLKRSLSTMVKSLNKTKTKLHKSKDDESISDELSMESQSSQYESTEPASTQTTSSAASHFEEGPMEQIQEAELLPAIPQESDLLPPIPQEAPCNTEELTPTIIPHSNTLTPQSSGRNNSTTSMDNFDLETSAQLSTIQIPRSGSVVSNTGLSTPVHEDDLADAMAISILERVKVEKIRNETSEMENWAI